MTATEPAWMEIHWPQPLDRAHVRGLLTRLAADQNRGPLVFEVRAEAGRIRYLLRSSGMPGVTLGRLLTKLVPGVIIAGPSAARADVDRVGRVRIRQRQLALGADQDGEILRAILAALAAARDEEDVLVLQVVLGTAAVPILVPRDALDPTASWTTALMVGNRQAGSEVRASMQTKLSQYRFRAAVRVGASSGSDARRKLLLFGILAALRGIQSPGTKLDLVPKRRDAIDIGYLPLRQTLRLSPDEAAIFLAWPAADTDLPGLPSPHPRQVPPPSRYTPPTERIFAASTAPGTNAPLGIAAADALRHTHIIGPTGVGKSTLMLHLIAADIAAGRSVVIIDPKRDLGMDVLSLIPEERRRDVVVLDPMLSQPVGLNPLSGDASAAPLVADNILAIFKGLFPSMFGPRTSDTLHGSLLTLASHPGATLTDLPALLTDASFRRRITARLDDPLGLEPFWAQYEAMSPGQQANAVGPVMTRLRQFLLRPQLRAVLGQAQPRFKLADVLTKKRIVIVTLNKGILGEQSAALLGSLIVSQLWQLILGPGHPPERPAADGEHLPRRGTKRAAPGHRYRGSTGAVALLRRRLAPGAPVPRPDATGIAGGHRRQHKEQDRLRPRSRGRHCGGQDERRPDTRRLRSPAAVRDLRVAAVGWAADGVDQRTDAAAADGHLRPRGPHRREPGPLRRRTREPPSPSFLLYGFGPGQRLDVRLRTDRTETSHTTNHFTVTLRSDLGGLTMTPLLRYPRRPVVRPLDHPAAAASMIGRPRRFGCSQPLREPTVSRNPCSVRQSGPRAAAAPAGMRRWRT